MSDTNKFKKNLLKKINAEPVVPEDENIDKRLRSLDEVTEHFEKEQLLGPNTHRSVLNAAELAKKGKSGLSKANGKSNGRDL